MKMKRYTILVADGTGLPDATVADRLANLLSLEGVPGATIRRATGLWRGETERSWSIMVVAEPSTIGPTVASAAQTLREVFNQDEVMLTVEDVEVFAVREPEVSRMGRHG